MRKRRGVRTPQIISQSTRSVDPLLREAIRNKRLIEFEYQQLMRVVEPHDYGIQKGIKKLLVYQVGGDSKSGRLPDWRLVTVASMKRVCLLDKNFLGGRSESLAKHKKWDLVLARVAQARGLQG